MLRNRRRKKGVASVVATLFAIMLGVIIVSNYISTDLPQYVYNQEYGHSVYVQNQFMNIQAAVMQEMLIHNSLITVYTPVTLGTPGLPPFASSSPGTLTIEGLSYGQSSIDVSYYHPNNGQKDKTLLTEPLGDIVLNLFNKYYPAQMFYYEDGAIFVSQGSNNVAMVSAPAIQFNLVHGSGNSYANVLNLSVIQIISSNLAPTTGSNTVGVGITMTNFVSSVNPGNPNGDDVYVTINSPVAIAWYNYFMSVKAQLTGGNGNSAQNEISVTQPSSNSVLIKFRNVETLNFYEAFVTVEIQQ